MSSVYRIKGCLQKLRVKGPASAKEGMSKSGYLAVKRRHTREPRRTTGLASIIEQLQEIRVQLLVGFDVLNNFREGWTKYRV